MTLLIVHETLLGETLVFTPDLLDYRLQAQKKSMLNTLPTFNWYMAGLVFNWLKEEGGIDVMEKRNQSKSSLLYDFIDTSLSVENGLSKMNVVFSLSNESLNDNFLKQAKLSGLHSLKGYSLAGGMCASLYNAMPESGVKQLVGFMR